MCDDNRIVRERQRWIRRQMNKRGITPTMTAMDGEWENTSTVLSWFPGDEKVEPATMSVAGLHRLLRTKALPVDLLSMLLPAGHMIVKVAEGVDYDAISALCNEFVGKKERFHHPDSEAGRELGPNEQADLGATVVNLRGRG